ncbi:histidine triad nucleotide-binding protein [Candidatus Gracilibacteria bacterium]|nr:histidine triad nucleotide-binding protein [Candidatus Gracilibacteria bacterium]
MTDNDCIFCKIINKEIPATIHHEDEWSFAFNDIHPKKRVHILIVPKKHIPTVADIEEGDEKIMGHLVKVANKLAKEHACKGYQLLYNVGKEAGQEVFHIHMHLMGN